MFFKRNENDQRECLGTKKDYDCITMTFDIGPFYFEYNHNYPSQDSSVGSCRYPSTAPQNG